MHSTCIYILLIISIPYLSIYINTKSCNFRLNYSIFNCNYFLTRFLYHVYNIILFIIS
nr:MAG TPA: hypothetical protein [Caudoviricetes sp.]